MKRLALLAVLMLALSGCSILLPIAKFLAIPVAKHLFGGSDDSQDNTEGTEDEEDQE